MFDIEYYTSMDIVLTRIVDDRVIAAGMNAAPKSEKAPGPEFSAEQINSYKRI